MSKKIISLVLALCMLPLTFINTYAEDPELNTAVSEAYDVLSALGYINGDYTEDMIADIDEFTRAEFAEMTYKVFGAGLSSDEVYFHDIPATHFAAEAVAVLVEMRILSVDGDKLFYPDRPVTKMEAAKILLYALGYGPAVEVRGGWTAGIEKTASDIKLYKNVRSGQNVSYGDMLVMFYNALTAEILEAEGVKNGVPTYKPRGGTYLSVNRDIYLGRGVVSSVDGVSIYGDKATVGRIQIDNISLSLNGINANEFLGREVEFLYLYNDAEEELIWIKSRKDDDVLLLKKYENQPEFSESGTGLTYYTDNGKRKTASISKNLSLIYNGAYVTAGIKNVLSGNFYDLRLIRSADSNSYDIAIINGYENYRIVSIPDENSIYLECCDPRLPNRNIITDSYERTELFTADGSSMRPSELSFGSIVSVFESKDNKVLRLVVSSGSVKGRVSAVSLDGGYSIIRINDTDYPLYKPDMTLDCKSGDEVTLLLDMNGKAAMIDKGTGANKFAYLISAHYSNETAEDELYIKIYAKDTGVKKYLVKDRLRVDGVLYKNMKSAYEAVGGDSLTPQIIAYERDGEDGITMLDLPALSDDAEKKTSDNMLVKIEAGSKLYDNLSMRLGHRTIMNSSSVIFGVPGNVNGAEDKEYAVASVSDLEFERSYDYTSYSYTLEDESFYADVLAIRANFSAGYWVSTRFAVNNLKMGVNDDGETVYIAEGYHGSEKKEIKLRASCNPDPANLHEGDVISVGSRIGDEVISYTLLYCPHTEPHTHVATNTGYSTGSWFDIVGYLYDVKGRAAKISYEDPAVWNQAVSMQNSKILLYEPNNRGDAFREVTPEELITYKTAGGGCDKVYVYINSSQMRNFIVFR